MEQNIFIYGSHAFVTSKFLMEKGVPESTIRNGISKEEDIKNRWLIRSHPFNNRLKIIAYDTIPNSTVQKYNLPNFSELVELEELEFKKIKDAYDVKESKHIKICFDLEYENWREIEPLYKNKSIDDDKIERFCKTHQMLSKALELNKLGFRLRNIFNEYRKYSGLVFDSENFNSFTNKLRKIKRTKNIENILLHGLSKRPSNNSKITPDDIIEVKRLFADPKKYNYKHITEELNKYRIRKNRDIVSRSTIEKIITQYVKNECMISRFGEKYTEDHLLPFAHFEPPQREGLLWAIDGSRFQFAYKSEGKNEKYMYLTYFVILDGHSKRIISYSCSESENSQMVVSALKEACKSTMYLPREITTDNSPAYKPIEISNFISHAKLLGCNWIISSNPHNNAYVERYFGVFQESYCKKYEGYIGDGIKSRNINGKPSPEEIKKHLSNKNLKTKDELLVLVNNLIKEYNNSDKVKKLITTEDFNRKMTVRRKVEPIPINAVNFSQLFWNKKDHVLSRSMISLQYNNLIHEYNIYDPEIVKKYSGQRILIRFDNINFSKIMLFDLKNEEYITTLLEFKRIPKLKEERTPEQERDMQEHFKLRKELKDKLKDGIKRIVETSDKNRLLLPPQLTEFYPIQKKQREETEEEVMNEQLHKIEVVERIDVVEAVSEDEDYRELFKNLFKEKGNLEIIKNGKQDNSSN